MHGTLKPLRLDGTRQAVRTFFCCVRMRVQAEGRNPRYSPWWPVTPDEYAELLRREGVPIPPFGFPVRDFESGPLQGRAIYREDQIAGWDQDLRALYAQHRASPLATA